MGPSLTGGDIRALELNDAKAVAESRPTLRQRFDALCRAYVREDSSPSREVRAERSRFIGELRSVLAASCIETLEPDLVILDEFQRFAHLLDEHDEEDDSIRLARELFNYRDPKGGDVAVLLLSATPYKMYTTAGEADGEDHYKDFVRTVRFLERADGPDDSLERSLRDYRDALLSAEDADAVERVRAARQELELRLRRVMVRTERLAATADRNGMLVTMDAAREPLSSAAVPAGVGRSTLTKEDVLDYVALQQVARELEHPDTLEYWKSAPYVLNFMDDGYKLRRDLNYAADDPARRGAIARALGGDCTLPWQEIERYGEVAMRNGRMRTLVEDTIERGAHRLLWVPPALPYYELGGEFAGPQLAGFTKRLVFSSWRLVPRAIAALLSYEAERQMVGRSREGANTPEARKRRPRLLRFGRSEGRLTGMPVMAMMYPSAYLARACDPAFLGPRVASGGRANREEVLREAEAIIEQALSKRLGVSVAEGGPADDRWYWAAPLLLDRQLEPRATEAWFEQEGLDRLWSGQQSEDEGDAAEEDEGPELKEWAAHVQEAARVVKEGLSDLGPMPADLANVLARIAIGGPGVAMLRSMLRVVEMRVDALGEEGGVAVRNGAARAAWSFRGLFNQPEVMALLRATPQGSEPYWGRVLDYCVDGCLQSVLDEYVHVLRDHLGVGRDDPGARVAKIAEQICDAMSLRTANLSIWDVGRSEAGRTVRPARRNMRSHFALRFGDEKADDGQIATRADSVRKAFNSPFWPFVVATTSVGQEGLDFHTYCHAVVHWNLPWNPVDLEQREGRVHRYKGHAVRKNVALVHGRNVLERAELDLWEAMFAEAIAGRENGATDIVPFWVYAPEGGARIERHVPTYPLSRELGQMNALSKSLAVYRMAFGQPRQNDLLRYLMDRVDEDRRMTLAEEARIDLAPPGEGHGAAGLGLEGQLPQAD